MNDWDWNNIEMFSRHHLMGLLALDRRLKDTEDRLQECEMRLGVRRRPEQLPESPEDPEIREDDFF